MVEYSITKWAWTLSVGLPISAVFAKLMWRRARESVWSRLAVCTVLACAITPAFITWSNGVIFFPAITMFTFAVAVGPAVVLGAMSFLPIGIVSCLLLGIWTVLLRKKSKLTSTANAVEKAGAKE